MRFSLFPENALCFPFYCELRTTLLQRLIDDQYFLNSLFEEGCEDETICQIKKRPYILKGI